MAFRQRLLRLRREIADRGLDALLITELVNVQYLTGFTGSSAVALVTPGEARLVTDFRYRLQALEELTTFQLSEQRGPGIEFLADLVRELAPAVLGFEPGITYDLHRKLRSSIRPVKLKAADGLVEKQRMVKDNREVGILERAVALTAEAWDVFLGEIEPGMTEQEAAYRLEGHLRRLGSGLPPFPIIVASGPNAAKVHGRASERVIGEGETIVIDFGAELEGYATDVTRTICFGKPPPAVVKYYRLVYDAQRSAIDSVRPGVEVSAVDDAARGVIGDAGMGDHFGHSSGHGVGLEVHEEPRLHPGNREKLKPGMIFTVEPGVYVEGLGGVRIEDMVLVTGDFRTVLTSAIPKPKEIEATTA